MEVIVTELSINKCLCADSFTNLCPHCVCADVASVTRAFYLSTTYMYIVHVHVHVGVGE